ncbi:hypothetical protein KC19_7G052600 [Ceratodon purpureus]|uniref:Uncharacterized protein n=1 Tax=Ceratodon purpureus TaxID=3225 RepID=A0A8T0HB03_CERPU|nr:hypothetical protein KC19_7G052600 [Ceratodon purpureus]
MDPPAAPSSLHPMVNDLNLKLQSPDNKTVYPNGMNKEDSINNVEVIHVMKPRKGPWRVTVDGARVVNDIQPYALVATGTFRASRRTFGSGAHRFHNFTSDSDSSTSAADRQGRSEWQNNLFLCVCSGVLCSILFLFTD